jgi:DNA polymerase-3 subunit epsilon
MSLDFTAIDFETANFDRGSVCAVGVTRVVDGEIRSTESWYINPPTGLDFTNTYIHGISARHVADAPTWKWTLERLEQIAGASPLVAYSPFDKGVYNAANRLSNLAPDRFTFLDALAVVKAHVVLDSYRLPLVVEHFELPDFVHHEAGADSLACALIVLRVAAEQGVSSTDDLWQGAKRAAPRPARIRTYQKVADLPGAREDADPGHPLFGEVVCFSGDLDSHTRSAAQGVVASFGASVSSNVTKKTSLVVMGGFDPATLRPGATLSGKVQRAMDLAVAGQNIEVITEKTFLELLDL